MENISKQQFAKFIKAVDKARTALNLPKLNDYDFKQYCEVLINGASLFQLTASMECSTRIDLVVNDDQEQNEIDLLASKFKKFTLDYLGLELLTHGDPRGAVFKLIVPETLGDSFGDRTHLCVPCVDCFQCLA